MIDGSSKPVGATTYKETAFGILPHDKLLELEIEGVKRGLIYIQSLKKSEIDITPNFIQDLHHISFGWIFPIWAGKFRTIQVQYSDKEAPSFYQIPELIHNLCEDLKIRFKTFPDQDDENFITKVIELIAWFQHRFVFIHPFQDYNGRTARMLTIVVLLKLKLPPIEVQVNTDEDRDIYLQAMRDADNGNYSLLEELLSKALAESLEQVAKTT
jgi:fido (protein-threonine AMPylation protein)